VFGALHAYRHARHPAELIVSTGAGSTGGLQSVYAGTTITLADRKARLMA